MKSRARVPAVLALCGALAATGGCLAAAVAAGAAATYGAIQYTNNEAYLDFRAPFDETWDASVDAMRENGYLVSSSLSAPSGTEGRIEQGDAKVIVEKMPNGFTRVRVRIGTFDTDDNRRRAGLILESIDRQID